MARTDFHKVVIGRADTVHFMDLTVADIPAKIDTGAYRSSVHASDIQRSTDGKTLSFTLLGGHPVYKAVAKTITTDAFEEVVIVNSFGHKENRYEVKLRIKLGTKIFTAAFTLADRSTMIYPILIGRKVLSNRFLVDTAYSQVNRLELKRQYDIDVPEDEEARLEGEGSI
jgi:hypothetical protein